MLFSAGLGTRLKPFTDKHPKALAKVGNKSLLERNILYLQSHNIYEVVVNVHHFASQIINVLSENNGFGSKIIISDEQDEVLETGGGLKKASHLFDNKDILVMNVDILSNLDLNLLYRFHQDNKSLATLAVMNRPSSRKLLFDGHYNLCGWQNTDTNNIKICQTGTIKPLAFSGIQIINSCWINHISLCGKFSIIDAYLEMASKGLPIKGYEHSNDKLIDVGKPENIKLAEQIFD